ncbi:hypothetical protein BH24GEM2_BH24GEM2_12340 [soil metagenome]
MARVGRAEWDVTAVAPSFLEGDLRPVRVEPLPGELCRLEAIPAYHTNRIHVFRYGSRLREILREPWDVVHCWEEPYIVVGGQIARWTPRRAALVYATFQNIPKQYPPPFRWIEQYAMRRAAGWIAFGQTIEEALFNRPGYSSRPHRVIPLGVDTQHFRPDAAAGKQVRQQLGWSASGPPVVGYLGRFVSEKGLDLLTRALDRVPVPWRALFVGAGEMEPILREWGGRFGERVRVVTGVAHDAVPAYLNAMDVLCAPSQTTLNWREQLGRMLIEAFACGVPVVASDSGEIPYVVKNAGVIIGEKDEGAWIETLSDLLDNSAFRRELSSKGLARVQSTYTWPIVAQQHLEFFDELLDSAALPASG